VTQLKDLIKFKDIGVSEWERFEQLADIDGRLWDVFWTVSKDKERVKNEKLCAFSYFSELVFPKLLPIVKFLDVAENYVEQDDINIIVGVLFRLVPSLKCEKCNCQIEYEVFKIKIEHDDIGEN
tara:strand:+ start:176 stop:547 length:372 start_codon:yes stop_codon:yes gene_type:complete